jgi:23S rRNA (guanosine2251-2'-O)-methyltransferase
MKASKDKYWLYGKHAVIAALNNKRRTVFEVLVTSQNKALVKNHKFHVLDHEEITKRVKCSQAVHQGIAAHVSAINQPFLDEIVARCKNKLRSTIVVLDQVTDPHNIGAIMRSAAAFSVDAVILPKHNSPDESATIAKTSSGALESLPLIHVTNLVSTLNYLQDNQYWVIGMDGKARDDVSILAKYEKLVIVLGGEGEGMRRLTAENCDLLVKIPISQIESLNVSNAAAVALYASTLVTKNSA